MVWVRPMEGASGRLRVAAAPGAADPAEPLAPLAPLAPAERRYRARRSGQRIARSLTRPTHVFAAFPRSRPVASTACRGGGSPVPRSQARGLAPDSRARLTGSDSCFRAPLDAAGQRPGAASTHTWARSRAQRDPQRSGRVLRPTRPPPLDTPGGLGHRREVTNHRLTGGARCERAPARNACSVSARSVSARLFDIGASPPGNGDGSPSDPRCSPRTQRTCRQPDLCPARSRGHFRRPPGAAGRPLTCRRTPAAGRRPPGAAGRPLTCRRTPAAGCRSSTTRRPAA